jgi:hypothetical protein
MKQKLDEVRTLAIKLYEAGQKEKRKQPKEIWGDTTWRDLPSESVAVWDAVAICAYAELRSPLAPPSGSTRPDGPPRCAGKKK